MKHQRVSKGFMPMRVSSVQVFKGCFNGVLRVFQGNIKGVSRKFQGCFKEVSRVF